jgi:hypothetical protein
MNLPRASLCTFVVCGCLCVLGVPALLYSQQDQALPTITFTLSSGNVAPKHYSITVDRIGKAVYESRDEEAASSAGSGASAPDPPYVVKFTMSAKSLDRVFALCETLQHFRGSYDYTKTRIAFTGKKTLAYRDAHDQAQSSYNWSENKDVQELTNIFQGTSESLEFVQRIEHKRRYDRLGLSDEMKAMEHLFQEGRLYEVQAVRPALESLVKDGSVLKTVRESARRMLYALDAQTQ